VFAVQTTSQCSSWATRACASVERTADAWAPIFGSSSGSSGASKAMTSAEAMRALRRQRALLQVDMGASASLRECPLVPFVLVRQTERYRAVPSARRRTRDARGMEPPPAMRHRAARRPRQWFPRGRALTEPGRAAARSETAAGGQRHGGHAVDGWPHGPRRLTAGPAGGFGSPIGVRPSSSRAPPKGPGGRYRDGPAGQRALRGRSNCTRRSQRLGSHRTRDRGARGRLAHATSSGAVACVTHEGGRT
jgi:hypothetical protein